jgi:hypothetical protein
MLSSFSFVRSAAAIAAVAAAVSGVCGQILLPPGGTVVTPSATIPGAVIYDTSTPFDIFNAAGALLFRGKLQDRVSRIGTGTLDLVERGRAAARTTPYALEPGEARSGVLRGDLRRFKGGLRRSQARAADFHRARVILHAIVDRANHMLVDFMLIPPPPPPPAREEAATEESEETESNVEIAPYFNPVYDKWRRGLWVWFQVTMAYPLEATSLTTLPFRLPSSYGFGTRATRLPSSLPCLIMLVL